VRQVRASGGRTAAGVALRLVGGAALVVTMVVAVWYAHLRHVLGEGVLLGIATLLVLVWLVSRWMLMRRIAWLRAAIERVGSGEPGVRLDALGQPAWDMLAGAFNSAMANLERDRELLTLREAELGQRNAALLSLREALDSHAIVSVTSIRGDIVFANDKFCRISGYSADELRGRNHRIVKSGAHDTAFYRELWSTIRAGRAWHGVLENRRKDGGHYWVQSSILPVLDVHGVPHRYISIRTDISSRERLRKGLELIACAEHGDALFACLVQGFAIGLDARWAGLSRLSADGRTFEAIACWDANAHAAPFHYAAAGSPCAHAMAMAGEYVVPEDLSGRFPDVPAFARLPGVESYRGLAITDLRGDPIGVLWALSDRPAVADTGEAALLAMAAKRAAAELLRQRAESELRDTDQRLELVIDGAGLGVWDWDIPSGRVRLNERWTTMLGYEAATAIEHVDDWWRLVHPDDVARVEAALQGHIDDKASAFSEEVRLRGSDGNWIWVLDSGRVIERDATGRPLRAAGIHLDITERKHAEQALAAERERLALAMRAGRIGFWDWDLTRGQLEVDDSVRDDFGAIAADLHTMREWFDLVHPDDRPPFVSASRDCRAGREPAFTAIARWRTQRGWVWLRTQGQVTARDATGRALRMMGMHLNIDEQRRAEERVREQEERLRLVVESAALGIWDWDMVTDRVDSDARLAQMLGYEPAHLQALSDLVAITHPEDIPRVYAATRAHLTGEAPVFAAEIRLRDASGDWRWVLSRGQVAARDARGRATRMLGIHLDIAEHKRAEAERMASEARFRVLVENAPVGIYLCDPQGHVVYANPPAERLYAMTARDAGADGWQQRVHPDDAQRVCLGWKTLLRGQVEFLDTEFRLQPGSDDIRYVRGRAHAVRVAGALTGFVGSIEDITKRYAASQEHDRLQAQLQQAQKMEALGQLTGGIAHDFNNILASILGYATLAHGRFGADNAKLAEYLVAVITAGERARDLIAKMLAFSRHTPRESGASMDVAALVREVATLLASVIPSGITLAVDVAADVPRVHLGATDLHQVLVNLAVNARDAMGESGRLEITVSTAHYTREICSTCHGVIAGEFVDIVCRDTGCGMDEALLKRVFDPFFTTKEVGKGTGMGLAVVHGVVHRAGGHVRVDSTPGVGTAFHLLLPSAPAGLDELPGVPSAAPLHRTSVRRGCILIVDDEPMIAAFLRELLETQGHTVVLAGDGQAALELVRDQPRRFDLVVTDQTMPRLSGVALVKAVRAIRSDLPAVLCTGFSDVVDLRGARASGVRRFLRKPVEAQTMLRVVSELLDAAPAQISGSVN